jgi:hypothetical protein
MGLPRVSSRHLKGRKPGAQGGVSQVQTQDSGQDSHENVTIATPDRPLKRQAGTVEAGHVRRLPTDDAS